MKRLIIPLALAATLLLSESCKETTQEKVLTKQVKFTKEGELAIRKAVTDSVIAVLDVEFARDDYETQTGLMYRKGMVNNQGMLFVFDDELVRSFYMKNTEFPLDIIYINSKKQIVSIVKDAKPLDTSSLPSAAPAQYVLEVNAGLSDTWGLEVGDEVHWIELE
ncbi:DUF192 domain-containing protein [Jejudonia soesokkakensis]|uniref:DUF192 domain-containing protein n=1 Tax=Jejudonia soesokkakensis TaxID=1323432 RepID=A0ABW2MX95_9FLAO